jgi:hypothetical protein
MDVVVWLRSLGVEVCRWRETRELTTREQDLSLRMHGSAWLRDRRHSLRIAGGSFSDGFPFLGFVDLVVVVAHLRSFPSGKLITVVIISE